MEFALEFNLEEPVVKPYKYEESQEFKDFLTQIKAMDRETLVNEINFKNKCLFFTERALAKNTSTDRTMHQQMERLNTQKILMTHILITMPKPKKARRAKPKKRR